MSVETTDDIEVVFRESGAKIDMWSSYGFNTAFLTPTDAFEFKGYLEDIPNNLRNKFVPGVQIDLKSAGDIVMSGYVDEIELRASRHGTELTIKGRDCMAPVVDSCADPRKQYNFSLPIKQIIVDQLTPFGFERLEDDALADNKKKTKKNRLKAPKKPRKLTSKPQYIQPKDGESIYRFLSRLGEHAGFTLWSSADGKAVIVGEPDFDQEPTYKVYRSNDAKKNNVISGGITYSWVDQPACIVCTGRGTDATNKRSKLRVIAVNELVGGHTAVVEQLLKDYKGALVLPKIQFTGQIYNTRFPRPLFLHDDGSNTLDDLKNFARRKLSEFQQRQLKATYTFRGHRLDGSLWTTNTIADVTDTICDWSGPLWVKSVSYHSDRSSGTTTTVELIRPHTLQLGES